MILVVSLLVFAIIGAGSAAICATLAVGFLSITTAVAQAATEP